LEEKYKWLSADPGYVSLKHEDDKVVTFERAGLFFVFNFHSEKSFSDYRVGISKPGKYRIVLDSDSKANGGHERIATSSGYFTSPVAMHGWAQSLQVYIPSRVVVVFALDE